LRLALELRPDIAIVDVELPKQSGFEITRGLRKVNSPVKLVFLTMYKDEDVFNTALDLGARAYVLKEDAVDDIVRALQEVSQGGIFLSQSVSEMGKRRTDAVRNLSPGKPQLEKLTATERRILKLIAEDRTTKEIAQLLNSSFKTVENHRLNICHKLDVHGSHSLLKFAFAHKKQL